jgi:hypothetical protein
MNRLREFLGRQSMEGDDMRSAWPAGLGLALSLMMAASGWAEEVEWRAVGKQPAPAPADSCGVVTLGRPKPLIGADQAGPAAAHATGSEARASYEQSKPPAFAIVARGQSPDPAVAPLPPPPPPPPPPGSREEGYNCGVATENPAPAHPILQGGKNFILGVPGAVTGIFQSQPGRCCLQSDHCFDQFISPVTNPFFFEDPRSLTEFRPIFIWQTTSDHTPIFRGGDIEYFGAQGRVAITDRLSLILNELGGINQHVNAPTKTFQSHTGFAEVALAPQYTVIRNDQAGRLLALGLDFQIPAGPHNVFQDTGTLSLAPYFSFGQSFGKSSFGSFNFLNTTGYNFSVDNARSEFLFTSFHLDYDVANLKKFYPLVELNWFYYTASGNSLPPIGFEGRDLYNFGAAQVSNHSPLSIAVGARYKYAEWLQFGIATEFPLAGIRDLNDFRLTVDAIFRY